MSAPWEYEQRLAKQRAEVSDGLFAATRRLRYSRERLADERQRRLRALLATAKERSPFYEKRLAHIDVDTFTEADLPTIPPLTKPDMMTNFDQIVTDPELDLALVNTHLDSLDDDTYLLDQYRTLATGGSSGVRGVFVYGWQDWITFVLLQIRWSPQRAGGVIGSTFARKAKHVSGALHAFFADDDNPVHHLPATMPLAEIVAGLNEAQPTKLQGYPTSIRLLAAEAVAGRLTISPTEISTCGELLTDDVRQAARDVWGVEISDIWGATEGIYAYSCGKGEGLHLPDDLAIIEPVDRNGNPVPPGHPAAKIYLTNLYNMTQPLIRYELTDAMTLIDEPCPCGSAHRRIGDLHGRLDDVLEYPGGIVVHTIGFYAALLHASDVTEYQVLQTQRGAIVKVRADSGFDTEPLRHELVAMMAEAGLHSPEVTVEPVDGLDRLWSGKLRRFIPLF